VSYDYSGSGFANTGITGSVPPMLISWKVTFSKAGTYVVHCLVHHDMTATVTVG
jgi:plastocyanin